MTRAHTGPAGDLSYETLKARQRAIRDGFPDGVGLRVHRAISWLQRAEKEDGDLDASFIFYWIAFNAAYADEVKDAEANDERSVFDGFFGTLTSLDLDQRIYNTIWKRYAGEIRLLLDNRYVFSPFWKFHNRIPGYDDWEVWFRKSKKRIHAALKDRDTRMILSTVFDRLYVLRNQLVHGGATWNGKVNRQQVGDGAQIMSILVPIFIDLIMDNPDVDWGEPYYPVVD